MWRLAEPERSPFARGLLPLAPHSLRIRTAALDPTAAAVAVRQGHFHLHVSAGPKGKGGDHAQYIAREGRFKAEKYGDIGEHEVGNLPEWARGSAARFFAAADDHERANGNTYREFEMSLPVDLSEPERVKLVREFVAEQLGDRFAYSWAIHEPKGHNPHVHIMFSERTIDGTLRGPEQYFKRANTKHPERGGHLKTDWFTGRGGPAAIERLRERWAAVQNLAFERLGLDVRVDHRSLEAQGVKREPGRHRGPAVSGIEARGEVAEVSRRREAERMDRAQERAAMVAEVRVVTREEMAAERVAVRERRELAREVTGEERELVLPLVAADRREQIGRAQAAAERRVERRQGLGIGELHEKLVAQARALRERIGREIGRVKAWVAERFPEPLKQIKERTRDLFAGMGGERPRSDKTRTEPEREAKSSAAELLPRTSQPTLEEIRRQGREKWLALRSETAAPADRRDVAAEPASLAPAATPESDAASERERLSRLTSDELQTLIRRFNPPSISQLVELEPAVKAMRAEVKNYQYTAQQARLRATQATVEGNAWRHAHGMQAKLHDLGAVTSSYLVEREAAARDAQRVHGESLMAAGAAQAQFTSLWHEATQRITQETAPAREKVAELRQFLPAAYERERLVKEFEQLARDRAAGRAQYQDKSPEWQAMAPKLRSAIDRYNREHPQVQAGIIDKFLRTPALDKLFGAELKQHREQVRDRDQGLSL